MVKECPPHFYSMIRVTSTDRKRAPVMIKVSVVVVISIYINPWAVCALLIGFHVFSPLLIGFHLFSPLLIGSHLLQVATICLRMFRKC